MDDKNTQEEAILLYMLINGTMTHRDGTRLEIMNFPGRIHDLYRKGIDFDRPWDESKYGKRFIRYSIKPTQRNRKIIETCYPNIDKDILDGYAWE